MTDCDLSVFTATTPMSIFCFGMTLRALAKIDVYEVEYAQRHCTVFSGEI